MVCGTNKSKGEAKLCVVLEMEDVDGQIGIITADAGVTAAGIITAGTMDAGITAAGTMDAGGIMGRDADVIADVTAAATVTATARDDAAAMKAAKKNGAVMMTAAIITTAITDVMKAAATVIATAAAESRMAMMMICAEAVARGSVMATGMDLMTLPGTAIMEGAAVLLP